MLKKPPSVGTVHLGPLFLKAVRYVTGNLDTVDIAHHIENQDDTAHACELRAAGQFRVAPRLFEPLGALDNQLANLLGVVVLQSAAMPVGAEHRWPATLLAHRPEEEAGDKVIRIALEIDLLDREAITRCAAVHDRIEGSPRGHRPEARGDEHLAAELLRTPLPCLTCFRHTHRKVAIEIDERFEPHVGRDFAFRQDPRWSGRLCRK